MSSELSLNLVCSVTFWGHIRVGEGDLPLYMS